MFREISQFYVGYLVGYHFNNPVLLCVSEDKLKVKYYLKIIRNLSKENYEIKLAYLDWDSIISLYEDYILQDFNEKIKYLTSRDINALLYDINTGIQKIENLYEGLREYTEIVYNVKRFRNDVNDLEKSINILNKHISKIKYLKELSDVLMFKSPVLSINILEYIEYMGYIQEDKKLTMEYYQRVYND